jgi:glycosyltransferase involved in cell wall biosynthesis
VIVANGITGDSRVQKIALSAAHDGWEVLLVGRSSTAKLQRSRIGEVKVLRVPVGNDMVRAENQRRKSGTGILQPGSAFPRGAEAWQATYESRSRMRSERVSRLGEQGNPLSSVGRLGLRGVSYLDRMSHRVRTKAATWDLERLPDPTQPVGDWRRDQPNLMDLDLAFGPVIERFQPDVIHVNDITMLNTGAIAAARLRRRGHDVKWIYDAHEYVAGVDWPTARAMSAYPQLEREFIRRADAVVTVSPEIAEIIREDHRLPVTPLVVRNTPVRAAVGGSTGASVRAAAEVSDNTPLLVYSGYIHAERGLDTAVDALPLMPDVHLAIVADLNNRLLAKLLRQANRVGVADRVHPVPYVAPQDVADYLASADLGIICSKKTINYELSLPTKLAEYVHAGLPVVVSDVKTLSAYVRQHQIGRVFEAGDPQSFVGAVRSVLGDREAMRGNISDAILDELSWERQTGELLALYRSLSALSPTRRPELGWDVSETLPPPRRPTAAAGRDASDDDDLPWRPLGNTKVKLGLGMANSAGQLAALAQAVTKSDPNVSAEVITRTSGHGFGYPSDVYVSSKELRTLDVQLDLVRRVLPRYTHYLSDAFTPVFGRLNGGDISGDLPALAAAGIKTGLVCHGSEIRDPDRHLERMPHSHYRHAAPDMLQSLRRQARHNADVLDRVELPVFVTTPDLLADVPRATWIPLVVDVDSWSSDRPVLDRPRPVVLHAPSKRWTKGTELFLTDLEEMDAHGFIELRLIEGVPWAEMRENVKSADIVIDQVAIGSYGTLACEAMAAGRPVIAHLTDTVIAAFDGSLPLVNTDPLGVRATVERLLDDRAGTVEIGRRAEEFARRVHDGRKSAEVLSTFLQS